MLYEVRNFQQVTSLSVHRTNELLNECGSVVCLRLIVGQVSPLGLHGQLNILTTTVDSGVVLTDNI